MDYVFMTDSDSDLPLHTQQELNIPYVQMPYALDGVEHLDDLGQTMTAKAFFDKMRAGSTAITSALNEENYLEYFEPILKEKDLLFVAFSSQMSSTINAARSAREKLLAKYPERKFRIVDTLSISAPMTILVKMAYRKYQAGEDLDTVADWIEANYDRAQAWFTVEDLKYLRRGGRISGAAATMGTMLDLKPIIGMSKEGKLVSVFKARGRKKALNYIVDRAAENIEDPEHCEGILIHADAKADADLLERMLRERIPGISITQELVGPVIGAHCGPGTVAFCFFGKKRPF